MIGSTAGSTPAADPAPNSGTSRPPARTTRSRLGALLLSLTLAVGMATGCGDSSEKSSATTSIVDTTTSTTGAPTSTSAAPGSSDWSADQVAVINAYDAGLAAFAAAVSDPPDPGSPALVATVGDPLLTEFRNVAATWLGFGQAARYPENSVHATHPMSVEVSGDTATAEICAVDDSVLYEPGSGNVLNDEVITTRIRADFKLVASAWILTGRERVESWQGVAGCALAYS